MLNNNNEDTQWLASLPLTLGFDFEEILTNDRPATEKENAGMYSATAA